jgi:small subunit ribosomal protein S6
MNLYEVLIIAKQDIQSAEVQKMTEELTRFIEELEGQVLKNEQGDIHNLAYEITKNQKGYYVLLGIKLSGSKVANLETKMRFNELMIRHRIFKVDAIDDAPSAFLRNASAEAPVAPATPAVQHNS